MSVKEKKMSKSSQFLIENCNFKCFRRYLIYLKLIATKLLIYNLRKVVISGMRKQNYFNDLVKSTYDSPLGLLMDNG